MTKNYSVHSITFYSDNKYKKAALRLKKQALNSSVFSSAQIWNPKLIKKVAPNLFGNLQRLINSNPENNVGYGFWYWKSVIIEQSLKTLPAGTILVYLDAGCYLNLNNTKSEARMNDSIQFARTHGSLAMQLLDGEFGITDLSEKSWTSQEVLDELDISDEYRNTNQIQAGIQILEVNSHNLAFATTWRATCESSDFELLMGERGSSNIGFHSHRYDQSIFSCLYKKDAKFTLPDETYFEPNWETEGSEFPIWAMRNRNGIDPFDFKIQDLNARILRRIKYILKRHP
jgi:hypothetical protein